MLHFETIEPATLGLLRKLQSIEELANVRLVGGTALAMQIGHRTSIDLDLFGLLDFSPEDYSEKLLQLGKLEFIKKSKNIQILLIDGIKVDIVNYHYPWLEDALNKEDIIMGSKKDIAAMKLNAISGRGTRKDFVDLYFLLNEYSLNEIMQFYLAKYNDGSEYMAIKSIGYFKDAEEEVMPNMLINVGWEEIKSTIRKCLKEYVSK
jgi:hypothetical protein